MNKDDWKNKNPNCAGITTASINAVRNATTSTPTATLFSIVKGAVSRTVEYSYVAFD
jgi:hypothetical protein